MAKIYVKEIGWMEVEESKEEINKALEHNPRWSEYTINESDSLIIKEDRIITIRTSEITAIE